MAVQNYEINQQVEKLTDHIDIILNNAFIRKALSKIEIPHEYRAGMDILTSRSEAYKVNGYLFDELYRGIIGLAMWSYKARTEILPELKYHLSDDTISAMDRVREQMALDNLKSNLAILTDAINNLYVLTVEVDKSSHKQKPPVYQRMRDLGSLGQLLTSDSRGLFL